MARVSGPMMSVDASGKFGGSMVFGKWKGRNYVRQLVTPKNPKSPGQTGVRSMMSFLAQAWAALGAGVKDDYDALALTKAISAFNAYVGVNLARWQQSKSPSQAYPAADASDAKVITTAPVVGGAGFTSTLITPAENANIWGVIVFRDTAEITTPSWTNAVAVIFCADDDPFTFVDSPLEAGTYHYRFAQFNTDGVLGTVLANQDEVVT